VSGGAPLGLPSAAALVVASMIGAGVFTTSGFALADLGSPGPVMLAWAVGAAVALCGALSYAALARRIPVSGGEYAFLSIAVHPLAGFLAGWVSLLAGFTAPLAVAAEGLQAYLSAPLGWSGDPDWLGSAALLVCGALHGLRMRAGVWVQNAAVALKVAAIAVFVGLGAALLPRHAPQQPVWDGFELGAFGVTLVWVSFAYSGWNAAVYVAGEVRDPERNLGRALLLGTALVAALYLALNAVFLCAAPAAQLAGRADVGAVAALALGGPVLRSALSGLVALALFTSISSMVMAGPRVYARMAEDGLFPHWFASDTEVPRAAVALQVGLALLVLWVGELAQLLSYVGFTLGLSSAASVLALVGLRVREGRARTPVPLFPWIPALFVAATLASSAFLIARRPSEAALGALTVATGLPAYAVLRRIGQARGPTLG
jgi:APA family basic amino acid/polyamine antiporter